MRIERTQFRADGIFGRMYNANGVPQAYTLEHAYENPDGTYSPKVPPGQYICVRGQHQLEGMSAPFTTFEVTDVPGHTNILIHFGNWNDDSAGCFLIGQAIIPSDKGQMITNSRATFDAFMSSMAGISEFMLTVQ
jgi:Family of unknown function (DUF5675)